MPLLFVAFNMVLINFWYHNRWWFWRISDSPLYAKKYMHELSNDNCLINVINLIIIIDLFLYLQCIKCYIQNKCIFITKFMLSVFHSVVNENLIWFNSQGVYNSGKKRLREIRDLPRELLWTKYINNFFPWRNTCIELKK